MPLVATSIWRALKADWWQGQLCRLGFRHTVHVHHTCRNGWDVFLLQPADATPILTRPCHQATCKPSDVVCAVQEGFTEVHGLSENVVQGAVGLPRVNVGKSVVVDPFYLPVRPTLDRESTKVAHRQSQHRSACPVGQVVG